MRYLVYYDSCDDSTCDERRAYWTHAQPRLGTVTNAAPYRVLTELQVRRVVSGHAEELLDMARNRARYEAEAAARREHFVYITNYAAVRIRAAVRAADQLVYARRRRERQRRRYCRIFRQ